MGINQVEQNSTKHRVAKYQPKNISELCAFVAAIRPGFKSMYSIFENREHYSYNIPTFDQLIQTPEMPNSFLLYQEMAMAALNFAGVPMSECYEVIKNIAKKRPEKVKKYKEQFMSGFKERLIEIEKIQENEAQEATDKVWQIIDDSCRYSFNASHSYSVAMDSLYGAYLKSHYPLQFYEVFLNILDAKGSQKDRMADTRKEAELAYRIRFEPFRFRQDNRKITADEKNNTMWNSLKALKGFGEGIAKQLYELQDNKYDTFIDLLIDLEEKGIMCVKIEDLIKIQYFNEFGENGKLFALYNEFTKGKSRYDKKHKDATKLKRIEALKQIESESPNSKIPLKEQMIFENEILGYVQATCNVDKKYVYIMDVNTKFAPRVKAYCLNNGKTESMKITKKVFNNNPIKKDDIIYISKVKAKPQKRYENGHFVDIEGTKEWWIEDYDIRTNEFSN
jgi:DNA polymerase III alpha subunit